MTKLVLYETALAQWEALIKEAQGHAAIKLPHDVEAYLSLLLARLTVNTDLSDLVVATEYLQAEHLSGENRIETLRDIADKCLIIAGLFPQRAEHKHVKISYFVNFGQTAYDALAHIKYASLAALFEQLSKNFINLMDVLLNCRQLPPQYLSPLEALELWADTQSQFAGLVLEQSPFINQNFVIQQSNRKLI